MASTQLSMSAHRSVAGISFRLRQAFALAALLFLGFAPTSLQAQLVIDDNVTGTDLANAIVGSGVSISNVTLDCGPGGSATFDDGNTTNIGITDGVLLTTGLATQAIGPNSSESTDFDQSSAFHGDPDLAALSAWPLEDACVLSFDFVPDADVISVQYVFASEEYNEYVCSVFNDIFAFFVNGPIPGGGTYNNENVALIPGTTLPVAINSVNNGTPGSQGSAGNCTSLAYSSFYQDNVGGATIEYDGFTVVLTAEVAVIPGQSYSFKFAIADVSDGLWDSGVFIKGQSFSVFNCQAGNLSLENGAASPLSLCAGDDTSIDVNTSSLAGNDYTFYLTQPDGTILEEDANGQFDPGVYGLGDYLVYGVSSDGIASLPSAGDNIDDISADADEGCFEVSAPFAITVESCCQLVVECPQPDVTTFDCIADIPGASSDDITVLDACGDVSISLSSSAIGLGCPDSPFVVTNTYTISDDLTTTTCEVVYTAIDDEAPQVFTTLEPITLECDEAFPPVEILAEDNCSEVTIFEKENTIDFEFEACEGFRTQTPGGWGSAASGDNPGSYRDANFAAAFPNGLTIGCDNTLTLTSSAAVEDFLPAGGAPQVLPAGNLVDVNLSNGLASHLVAATLTLTFDAYDAGFSASDTFIGDLVYNNGIFVGMSVSEVIDIANAVIGGCSTEYSPSQLVEGLTTFNQNYVDGTIDNGNFSCQGTETECLYTVIRCWIVEDECGNFTTVSQEVTIADTEGPQVAELPIAEITLGCNEDIPEYTPEWTDNCGEVADTFAASSIALDGCIEIISRSWTAVDACGNETTVGQTITRLNDSESPMVANPPQPEINLGCNEEVPDYVPEWMDNCDDELEVFAASSIALDGCTEIISRSWSAIDDCGNETTISQIVTRIVDTEGPVVVNPPQPEVQLNCNEEIPAYIPEWTDNCVGELELSAASSIALDGCIEIISRSWTAVDACGNETTVGQTITRLNDSEPPMVANPPQPEINLGCNEEVPDYVPEWMDNCDDDLEVFAASSIALDGCTEIISRSWSAIDDCGNETTISQIVTRIVDTEGPVVVNPPQPEVQLNCNEEIPEYIPEWTDNCVGELELSAASSIALDGCLEIISRSWTAVDACGNETTVNQTITRIVDTEGPIVTNPPQPEIELACGEAIPDYVPDWTDNCSGDLELFAASSIAIDGCFEIISRSWTAIDACGNETTVSQVITQLNDEEPPVFGEFPYTITAECDAEEIPAPPVTDDCDQTEITFEDQIQSGGCYGYIVRTWIATDGCGNVATAEQIIELIDTTAPEIEGIEDEIIFVQCGDEPMPNEVFATDNCSSSDQITLNYTEFEVEDPEVNYCAAVTPEAYSDGLTCAGSQPASLKLFDDVDGDLYYEAVNTLWAEQADGSILISGDVVQIDNPDNGFTLNITLENGLTWDEWSNQGYPTSYLDDCDIAGDNYLDWMYYLIAEGATLTGWGGNEGITLDLEHAPGNNYYGAQVGVGANGDNLNLGSAAWFTYTSNSEAFAQGAGDFFFDLECCDQAPIERTWTAIDCAGNVSTFTQTVYFIGSAEDGGQNLNAGCLGDLDGDGSVNLSDLLIFLSGMGCSGSNCTGDINLDDSTDVQDLMMLLSVLGTSCQ
jgi:hypothetical protein